MLAFENISISSSARKEGDLRPDNGFILKPRQILPMDGAEHERKRFKDRPISEKLVRRLDQFDYGNECRQRLFAGHGSGSVAL